MEYEVVSRFYDRARDVYVDPGASCPPLDARTAERLVDAGCLVPVRNIPVREVTGPQTPPGFREYAPDTRAAPRPRARHAQPEAPAPADAE